MHKLLSLYKPVGKTPLEMVKLVKEKFPEYRHEPIGYAGRLDPLAHGVLLLMIGDATRNRDEYLHLDKVYEFEALFGLETDTYDYLGLLETQRKTDPATNVNIYVNSFVKNHIGTFQQPYPPFSSKSVRGKPLFWWAKEGRLEEIVIPQRSIEVANFTCLSLGTMTSQALQKRIIPTIQVIQGDFRQQEILEKWSLFFKDHASDQFVTAKFRISCSSGTYIRGLVHELGQTIQCGAIAIDIRRISVGEYTEKTAIKL